MRELREKVIMKVIIPKGWRKDHGMSRFHTTFLGYRIYRKKFLGTTVAVLLLSIMAFLGMLVFFVNTWMSDLRQQAQSIFLVREQQLADIESWALDYANGLYESTKLMEDLKALFLAKNEAEYLDQRRQNSMESPAQIRYLPADLKRLFSDNRGKISGIALRSESGTKTIWLENGDIRLSFSKEEGVLAQRFADFGNILATSYSFRDPQHMNLSIGTMDFWINSSDIYGRDGSINADWALLNDDGSTLYDSGLTAQKAGWIELVAREEEQSGWIRDIDSNNVFYIKYESSQSSYTYIVVKETTSVMQDNLYVLLALFAVLVLFDAGILVCSYVSIQADANFLATIMSMLSSMEDGDFERVRDLKLPVWHRENEYGMIAVALKDVGMKLKGYIETEYILKLKEQETQMRALQHQINPHFLYNTLESLRSKALIHGDQDMADAIAMLGSLYRARMHKQESVFLKEEFELLEMYLKIMTLRHGDRFVYQIELDPAIEDIKTVTFWLQPLAENFFAHGFDRESEYNLLIVSGHAQDGGAQIEIIDNGFGVKPETLPEIRQNMYEGNDDPEADIGLRNVFMRLNYFYGEGFEMDIGNNVEGGFCISIFIPGKVDENVHVSDRG